MTINHDLNHELELARIYQSPAIIVRVLDHLAAEVARLDGELARVRGDNQLLIVKVSALQNHLNQLRTSQGQFNDQAIITLNKAATGLERSLSIDDDLAKAISVLSIELDRLSVLHMDSKAGHGRAILAGEHTTPVETLEKYGQHS